jgi:hypothetical protein
MAMPTWDQLRAAVGRLAMEQGEWAGLPMPVEGTSMRIHPSYPFAEQFSEVFCPEPSIRACHADDVREDVSLRNAWRSYRDGRMVEIWQEGKKFFRAFGETQNAAPMLIHTVAAARAWDFEAEVRAMATLKRHLTKWAFQCYLITGSFLESSKRSGVFYLFRRLRPTIAMTANRDCRDRDVGMRILCCLCAHPIGYYEGSWAGALVPTDDVIAHLLMMRADEHYFWRICNQHHPMAPESGL